MAVLVRTENNSGHLDENRKEKLVRWVGVLRMSLLEAWEDGKVVIPVSPSIF